MTRFLLGSPVPRVKLISLLVAAAVICGVVDMVLLAGNHISGAYTPAVLAVTGLGLASALWGVRRARTGLESVVVAIIGTAMLVAGFAAAYASLDSGFLPSLDARGSFQVALSVLGSGQPGSSSALTDHATMYVNVQRLVDILYVFAALAALIFRLVTSYRREPRRS